jgi:CRISPR type I-E-associated protein CasB/Cse2
MNFERHGGETRRKGGASRAALAELRHAAGPVKVFLVPAALDLLRRLRTVDSHVCTNRVAVAAVALANLRPDPSLTKEKPVSRAIGRDNFDKDDSAPISEGRFRRLLQSGDEELLEAFRRLVRQMKGKLDPESLAGSILHWDEATQQRWIFDYYAVGSAAPAVTQTQDASIQEDHHG